MQPVRKKLKHHKAGGKTRSKNDNTWTSTNSTKAKPQLASVVLSLIKTILFIPLAPSLCGPEDVLIANSIACGPDKGSNPRKRRTAAGELPMSRVPSFAFVMRPERPPVLGFAL